MATDMMMAALRTSVQGPNAEAAALNTQDHSTLRLSIGISRYIHSPDVYLKDSKLLILPCEFCEKR